MPNKFSRDGLFAGEEGAYSREGPDGRGYGIRRLSRKSMINNKGGYLIFYQFYLTFVIRNIPYY